jgi:F-type H+-transporting ATPase subunit epsilon
MKIARHLSLVTRHWGYMALPEKIHLVVVTPEKQLFNGLVDRVTVPSSQGYLGILPGHAPLLTELGIGNISCRIGEESEFLFCSWGFAEVLPDRVVLLAQVAEAASEIDRNRAEQAKSRAEKRLASKNPDLDFARAQLALLRALSRLEAARHSRSPKGLGR